MCGCVSYPRGGLGAASGRGREVCSRVRDKGEVSREKKEEREREMSGPETNSEGGPTWHTI